MSRLSTVLVLAISLIAAGSTLQTPDRARLCRHAEDQRMPPLSVVPALFSSRLRECDGGREIWPGSVLNALARTVTIASHRQIDAALQDMIHAGVRSLLVIKEGALVGFVTSYDIQGEKPLLFIQSPLCIHEHCRHQDVCVEDIMTPIAAAPANALATLPERRLGDLLATFDQHSHSLHLLVVESDRDSGDTVRGLISRTQVQRLLEMDRSLT